MFRAVIKRVKYIERQMHSGFMRVILLRSVCQHVAATQVPIVRVMATRIQM